MTAIEQAPQAIHLKDYTVPDYLITKTELHVDIYDGYTLVTSNLSLRANPAAKHVSQLRLHGTDLELISLSINGNALPENAYEFGEESLTINNTPTQFLLTCITKIYPEKNTSLEGLYKSLTMYCTQCEAEGFRKITYYLDRPDVMSEFTTTLVADKKFPVLLSNGNLIGQGELDHNRHFAT
ncbi:MAG: aminopeptidase N, partial [Moraxellaceae bacterium]